MKLPNMLTFGICLIATSFPARTMDYANRKKKYPAQTMVLIPKNPNTVNLEQIAKSIGIPPYCSPKEIYNQVINLYQTLLCLLNSEKKLILKQIYVNSHCRICFSHFITMAGTSQFLLNTRGYYSAGSEISKIINECRKAFSKHNQLVNCNNCAENKKVKTL
ncbi:hypothetical protein KAU11_11880 [Candidatus Babeliales bacterium]|nr:hypothetical protein [Candidatus Babeliales bacterium]